jgi:hypothetical protein
MIFVTFGEDGPGSSEMAQSSDNADRALTWRPPKTPAFNNRLCADEPKIAIKSYAAIPN